VPDDAPAWVETADNPYLQGLFAPVSREVEASDLEVVGELPEDLDGVFLRNGPNPVHAPRGRYHWFDGDGMLHALAFRGGRAAYRNRYVRTSGLAAEAEAGRALWPGYMERPDPHAPRGSGSDGWLKDTANTDLVPFGDSVLALWYQCGTPTRVDPRTLATHGPEDFGGRLPRQVSAHAKQDPETGELLFFDYATREPYLAYHVVDPDGRLAHSVPIDVPGPRLPHDMAFTERHAILMDLPLFWDPALLPRGIHKLGFHRELPSRFAVVPRRGGPGDVRWFETEPAYIYHVVNAWEEGSEIVMDACRVVDPDPSHARGEGPLGKMMAVLRLDARLHRWRFDLATGASKEEALDDRNAEFPSANASRAGRPTRFAYLARIADEETLLFDGIVKLDTQSGRSEVYDPGPDRFASEAPFAPRVGGDGEDDGYVVTFVSDRRTGRSEVHVLAARDLAAGPVARVLLPQRVPIGFHACWVPGDGA